MHALSLAGGEGARLRSDGIRTPKAFVEVHGRPLLLRLVDTLRALGCETITAAVRKSALAEAGPAFHSAGAASVRVLACETPSSLHTLAAGLQAVPPGPLLCVMVDSIMREEDWRRLFARADHLLRNGADACVAVTPHGDDEKPLYVVRRRDGSVAAFRSEPVLPALLTGGVYFMSTQVRDLAPRVLALGVVRMRGFLSWLAEHGYRIETVEVERIMDLDRGRDVEAAGAWLAGGRADPSGDSAP
jgi:NDP-sugar pyrophosphorylase family protein